jgi:hypothetical protein
MIAAPELAQHVDCRADFGGVGGSCLTNQHLMIDQDADPSAY